jgi:hypothetical protein
MKKSPFLPAPRRFCMDSCFAAALFWLGFTAAVCGTALYSWRLSLIVGGLLLLSAFWRLYDRSSRP